MTHAIGDAAAAAAQAVARAGTPYHWGGGNEHGPSHAANPHAEAKALKDSGTAHKEGFDCSGLTVYVYAQQGVHLPHGAAAQLKESLKKEPAVRPGHVQPGDLVLFTKQGQRDPHHVGVVVNADNRSVEFAEAPYHGEPVSTSTVEGRAGRLHKAHKPAEIVTFVRPYTKDEAKD